MHYSLVLLVLVIGPAFTYGREIEKSDCFATDNCLRPMFKKSLQENAADMSCEKMQDAYVCLKNLPPSDNSCSPLSGKMSLDSLFTSLNKLLGTSCPLTYGNNTHATALAPPVKNIDDEEADTECAEQLTGCIEPLETMLKKGEVSCTVHQEAYQCLKYLSDSLDSCLTNEEIEAYFFFRMYGNRCDLNPHDDYVTTIAPIVTDEEGEENDCTQKCLRSLMNELRLHRTKADGFCVILKDAYKCLKNMSDAEVCLTSEEMKAVNAEFSEINDMLRNRCELVIDDDDNDDDDDGNDDDDDDDEETELLLDCVRVNQEYLLECTRELTIDVLTSAVSDANSDVALKCSMIDNLFDCLATRIEEECGSKVSEHLSEIIVSKLPEEMMERCGTARTFDQQNLQLNITDDWTFVG